MPSTPRALPRASTGSALAGVSAHADGDRGSGRTPHSDSGHCAGCRLPAVGLSNGPFDGGHGARSERFGGRDHRSLRGPGDACEVCRRPAFPPPAARILAVDLAPIEPEAAADFEIVHSHQAAERLVSIPPDLTTCDDCVREIFDPTNRRYRYPFTNCTNCGPRFTIATDIPYDRAATTMAPFRMCPDCQREYENVEDRRFHAQPNACPTCGPRLTLHAADGVRIHADDVIAVAAQALREGLIVAIKGMGGFHLACDATNDNAVKRLRQRKRRDEKPLAVMARSLAAARALAVVDTEAARRLTSVERPILLVPRRAKSRLAPSIAPNNRMVGVFLPVFPDASPAARRREAPAGDDVGQPVRRADRLPQRRSDPPPRRHRRSVPAAQPGHRNALRRFRRRDDCRARHRAAAVPRIRASRR